MHGELFEGEVPEWEEAPHDRSDLVRAEGEQLSNQCPRVLSRRLVGYLVGA
jgi:hypothetical protein